MQTFLPFPSFEDSAKALDYKRLGKQRVEAAQLIRAINGQTKGWANHPAAVMWRGHLDALKVYHNVMVQEWVRRGYKNTMPLFEVPDQVQLPWWVGFEALHFSHRSNLIRKDPAFYQFNAPDNQPYIWPSPNRGYYRVGNDDYVHFRRF